MYLLDTNVVSEMRRVDRANSNVVRWIELNESRPTFVSAITFLEIRFGALSINRRDPVQGRMMQQWFEQRVMKQFAGRVLAIDAEVAIACAELHGPNPRPDRDAYIAATALVHDLTVVSRNARDFAGTGVKLLNPWNAA